jgi:hypothetical protein
MYRWSVLGIAAIFASVLGAAWFVAAGAWRASWTVPGLLVFVSLWLAGVVTVTLMADRRDAARRERKPMPVAVRPAYLDANELRYQPHAKACVSLAYEARACLRADTGCAEPTPSRAAPVRPTTEGMMMPHETRPSPAVDSQATAQQAAIGAAHRDQILRHLIERYLTGDRLPAGTPNRFTVAEFHRLFRHVVQEGYGE